MNTPNPTQPQTVQQILEEAIPSKLKTLFSFDQEDSNEKVLAKFNLWARYFFPKYFTSPDAPFHNDINLNNLKIYRGEIESFVDVAFRGAGKDVKTKLFVAFVIANDPKHFRRYFKVLSEDGDNSAQTVTDIYNMLTSPRIVAVYPEIFEKTGTKREERMSVFTTSTGVKVLADTVGTEQRGAIQEDARPDFIWFNDFETRKTLRSARNTLNIWENMEEARTGLQKGGGCVYTCNYLSEQGNVHKLVSRETSRKVVLIMPIIKDGVPTWNRYTVAEIEQMKEDDEDFEGERLCEPSATKEVLFDREKVNKQVAIEPHKTVGGFRMYRQYDPSHAYASGHDVAGGVGLDSSSSVFIDFSVNPAQVVATYDDNNIKPDTFAYEIKREGEYYGECLVCPESNNHGHATLAILKGIYNNIFFQQEDQTKLETPGGIKEYGWKTNALTKPQMLFGFVKAVNDGLVELNDKKLIAEVKSYTRNDLMERPQDVRMVTRHFDLLIAACIAWQMKDYAMPAPEPEEDFVEDEPFYPDIGI